MCNDPRDRALLSRNLDAERSVLGSMLVTPSTMGVIDLRPDEFYAAAHQAIYAELQKLHARGTMADFVTLTNALRVAEKLDDVGGPAYVAGLADGVPRASNVEHYATVVRDHAVRRRLVHAALEVIEAARGGETAEAALAVAEEAMSRIGADVAGITQSTADTTALLAAAGNLIDRVQATGQAVTGLPTGLVDLDLRTRGMHPGRMVVVGARIGRGKSTLGLNIARHASTRGTVLFWSGEMDHEDLGIRLLVSEAHVDGHRLQSGLALGPDTFSSLSVAMGQLSDARLVVDESGTRTVPQVRRLARRLQAVRKDLVLIVLDYIGLITPERHEESRAMTLASISRSIKVMARDLRVPVVVLAQLNREVDKRSGKQSRPTIADLGESSGMEKDADHVWLLHQDKALYDEGQAEIVVAKNRGGPRGIVKVAYFPEQYRFANLDTHHAGDNEGE